MRGRIGGKSITCEWMYLSWGGNRIDDTHLGPSWKTPENLGVSVSIMVCIDTEERKYMNERVILGSCR